MASSGYVVSVETVPEDSTYLFTVRDTETGEKDEAILIHGGEEISAWLNRCMHFTHIRLDKGSGAEVRESEIVCTNHGAMFEADTGLCTFGPCAGATLEELAIEIEGGAVHLTDDRFEFVSAGPLDDGNGDLTSTSNVEF